MRKLFSSSFSPNRRMKMVRHCAERMLAGQPFIYLAPSRESMFEVRSQLMDVAGSLFNGHVWGFDDLVQAILKGVCSREDVIGRHEIQVLVQSVIRKMPDPRPYQDVLQKPGFLRGLCKTIADLKRAGVIADSLRQVLPILVDDLEPAHEKTDFLANVFSLYQARLAEGGWLDKEDLALLALDHVSTAECLSSNTLLVIDGFQRLDASRLKLLKRIADSWPNMDMMANVQSDIQEGILADLLGLGFEYSEPSSPCATSVLSASDPMIPTAVSETSASKPAATLVGHPCRDHELRETARSIMRLVSEKGVAPQQVAVFCPDKESYRLQLNDVFAEMGIPIDSSDPVPLYGLPLVRDLMSLLLFRMDDQYGASMKNLVASKYLVPLHLLHDMGYETDRLLQAAMKCDGLADPEQWNNRFIAELRKNGLFHVKLQEWLDSLRAFHPERSENPSAAVHALLEYLNRLDPEEHVSRLGKQRILSPELFLRDRKALATFRVFLSKTASVWEHLTDMGVHVLDDCDVDLVSRSEAGHAATLPAGKMSNQPDTDWYPRMVHDLETLLESIDIGNISTDHAGVRFLSPDMASGQSYHTIFLLGMNEGVFPRPSSQSILFVERESELLRRHGIPLHDPRIELLHEQYLFQTVLATARNGLNLSWCTASEDGALMNVSPFVDDVADRVPREMLPTLRPKPLNMRDRVAGMPRVRTGYPLTAAAMEREREYSPSRGAYDGQLNNPLLAQQETDFSFSPSQLNGYAYCPFTYFTERVLGLAKEDDEPLNAMTIGTFYHDVLRAYHDRAGNVSSDFSSSAAFMPNASSLPLVNPAETFDRQRLESIFEALVLKLDFSMVPPLVAEHRKMALLSTLTGFLELDAANLSRFRQETGNRLMPMLLEHPFSLSFGPDFRLKGIVDRVDLEVDAQNQFTGRYILYDYKKKNLKELKNIVLGEDFQLPLYRTALQAMLVEKYRLKKPECLALLYFSIEKLEWKGIIRLDMKKVLFETRKRPQTLTGENMNVLLKWVEDEAGGVVSRIRNGDFRIPLTCPADARQYDCLYSEICRHDVVRMTRKSDMMMKQNANLVKISGAGTKLEGE